MKLLVVEDEKHLNKTLTERLTKTGYTVDSCFDGEDALQKGQNYKYPHDYKGHYVNQQYLPDNIKDKRYYQYGDNKNEQLFKEYWDKIKK